MNKLLLVIAGLCFVIPQAFAAPGDNCYEQSSTIMDCFNGNIFNVVNDALIPLDVVVPNFGLVIIWGGLIGILWFKTENVMLVGVCSVMAGSNFVVSFYSPALGVGFLLFGVCIGVFLFQLIRQRINLLS